jgi:hypothetical protein
VKDMAIPGMGYLCGLPFGQEGWRKTQRWTGSGRTIGSLENDGGLRERTRVLGVTATGTLLGTMRGWGVDKSWDYHWQVFAV